MKITIDTSQDSHSEIKKAIRMLQSIVGHSDEVYTNAPSRNIFDDPSPDLGQSPQESIPEEPVSNNAFASMFDTPDSGDDDTEPKPETEEDEEIPQIEFF
ncbi:hypothetical protein KY333_00905 [Candidatus Woesearchaeota archaeon]|nr:hypothetical protein [Candidatus Woesearchaeota archaeon]MBW2994155.1 hypothetical protein [Candidatus Woesearchaeota archaeon]